MFKFSFHTLFIYPWNQVRTQWRHYHEISRELAMFPHFIDRLYWMSVSISVHLVSFRLCMYGHAFRARCSIQALQATRGDSWHGFEYMCFWKDTLSYVNNVLAPPGLQAAPPYMANHLALLHLGETGSYSRSAWTEWRHRQGIRVREK